MGTCIIQIENTNKTRKCPAQPKQETELKYGNFKHIPVQSVISHQVSIVFLPYLQ